MKVKRKKKRQNRTAFEQQEDKIMTTDEIYNFNRDNEDMEIVKDFAYLGPVINSHGDCNQEKAVEELGDHWKQGCAIKRPNLRSFIHILPSQLLCTDVKGERGRLARKQIHMKHSVKCLRTP